MTSEHAWSDDTFHNISNYYDMGVPLLYKKRISYRFFYPSQNGERSQIRFMSATQQPIYIYSLSAVVYPSLAGGGKKLKYTFFALRNERTLKQH